MGVESALGILLWIVVIFAVAWLLHWVITTYFVEPLRTPVLLIAGVILLIIVVSILLYGGPVGFPLRR